MMWVLMALVAAVLGVMMFSNINPDDIPDELAFLKNKPSAADVQSVATEPASVLLEAGWSIRMSGSAVEATKRFSTPVRAGAHEYESAVMGLMCDGTSLHIRIDTQAPVTGRTESPVKVNGRETNWYKAQGTNLLAADAKSFGKALLASKGPVVFEMSYLDVGLASSTFDPSGLKPVVAQFPEACRF